MTPAVWVILAVVACFLSYLGIVRFVTTNRQPGPPARGVTQCDLDGHGLRFRSRDLQWSCATCGESLFQQRGPSDQIQGVEASASPTWRVLAGLGNRSARLIRQ